jgi:Protein of unknown function (DUF551)
MNYEEEIQDIDNYREEELERVSGGVEKREVTEICYSKLLALAKKMLLHLREQNSFIFKTNQHKWIPCSERLPERNGACWCTYKHGKKLRTEVFIFINGKFHGVEVIAWMPLPEPYLEKQ